MRRPTRQEIEERVALMEVYIEPPADNPLRPETLAAMIELEKLLQADVDSVRDVLAQSEHRSADFRAVVTCSRATPRTSWRTSR